LSLLKQPSATATGSFPLTAQPLEEMSENWTNLSAERDSYSAKGGKKATFGVDRFVQLDKEHLSPSCDVLLQ
jgi:hypothetical protein